MKITYLISLIFFFAISSNLTASLRCFNEYMSDFPKENSIGSIQLQITNHSDNEEIEELNNALLTHLINRNYSSCPPIIKEIIENISILDTLIDDTIRGTSYYYIGVYNLLTDDVYEAIKFLNLCIVQRESSHIVDDLYWKALYNIGLIYARLGDYRLHEFYSLKSLEAEKSLHGEDSYMLLETYSSLINAYTQLQEYEKAIYYSNIALAISEKLQDSVQLAIVADLYSNLGVCFTRIADYKKADILFDKAESIYRENGLEQSDSFINLLNNRASTYSARNMINLALRYYEMGIEHAISGNSGSDFNIINSYAIILANQGNKRTGEELLRQALERARVRYGSNSIYYIEVLKNYADFLREYDIDNKKSLELYEKCIDFLGTEKYDIFRTSTIVAYSLSLAQDGQPYKALDNIQKLLFPDGAGQLSKDTIKYVNPDALAMKADINSLKILKAKYDILKRVFNADSNLNYLELAASTSVLMISLLEKVRINISEDDSRLILGDKYRNAYLYIIGDFKLLYSRTDDYKFLEKIFEYSEKSKVAGLLASTRELKASQFHIPQPLADFEKRVKKDISLYDSKLSEEALKINPDSVIISSLKDKLLKATRVRDSLVTVFEQVYPEYYSLKYNVDVVQLNEIDHITGRNSNYLSYLVSDTIIYAFVANKKHQQLVTISVDSAFFRILKTFRDLLSTNPPTSNARDSFEKFSKSGNYIYNTIVAPIRDFLVSDELIISPDNILSYIPFETLLTEYANDGRMQYRDLSYLLKEFNISYTYSATFLAESVKRNFSLHNKLIAFAPKYSSPIELQSVLNNRQSADNMLYDLPFARQEATYVSHITRGKLFINDEARESVYKKESGKYDIIHLAMHTVLNDANPMNSILIFSQVSDSIEDNYLKTYEIYGHPLKAKMVVLSSCNTGAGILAGGEGILSLARGFKYSGCQSVVMAMWEIEDRSGTEVVSMFYDNLKKGMTKSSALKKARLTYLKKAGQLRSHPYYWATLVIYGDDAPLFLPFQTILPLLLIVISFLILFFYLYKKRKYS